MSETNPSKGNYTGKRPILVVDDEPEMLYSLRELLRLQFDVYTAGSGAEGIQLLHEKEVHLVMTDQRMPEMTGVEFLKRVKNDHPEAIRLIFTGYADIGGVIDAINQGNVYRYIAKPWNAEDLLEVLRDAGTQHDHIVERHRLLGDLKRHEEEVLVFEEQLRAGNGGVLSLEGAARMESLESVGRTLLARLSKMLPPR